MPDHIPSVAIIGTAGRGEDAAKLSRQVFDEMVQAAAGVLPFLPSGRVRLVSGGAAWADHVAVQLFLSDPNVFDLELHLPAPFEAAEGKFRDFQDARGNSIRDWRTNPGGTSNYYHRAFSAKLGRNSLLDLASAIKQGAQVVVGDGFQDRNSGVAQADAAIALTFGKASRLKDGGTSGTMGEFLALGRGQSWHIDLNNWEVFSPARVDQKYIDWARERLAKVSGQKRSETQTSPAKPELGGEPVLPKAGMSAEDIYRFYEVPIRNGRPANWFSNFEPFNPPLVEDGIAYRTVENYFQAQKSASLGERGRIAAATAAGSKKMGHDVKLRPDWESVKIAVMEKALRHKFTQDASWRAKLLASDPAKLVEVNNWKDVFWGYDVNLRRGEMGDELGGHIVSGHTDGVARLASARRRDQLLRLVFEAPGRTRAIGGPKGSVTLDGVSLTVNEVEMRPLRRQHHPASPPAHTTLGALKPGDIREHGNRHAGAIRCPSPPLLEGQGPRR